MYFRHHRPQPSCEQACADAARPREPADPAAHLLLDSARATQAANLQVPPLPGLCRQRQRQRQRRVRQLPGRRHGSPSRPSLRRAAALLARERRRAAAAGRRCHSAPRSAACPIPSVHESARVGGQPRLLTGRRRERKDVRESLMPCTLQGVCCT